MRDAAFPALPAILADGADTGTIGCDPTDDWCNREIAGPQAVLPCNGSRGTRFGCCRHRQQVGGLSNGGQQVGQPTIDHCARTPRLTDLDVVVCPNPNDIALRKLVMFMSLEAIYGFINCVVIP